MSNPMYGLMMKQPLTLTTLLTRAAKMFPHQEIIAKNPDGSLSRATYAQTYRRICKLAHALSKLGLNPGDRIGTYAWNHLEHLELYYAVPCSGFVLHTLNIRLFADQLAYIINHAEDQVIFVDSCLLPLFEKAAPELKTVKKYVIMGASKDIKTTLSPVIYYDDLITPESEVSEEMEWPALDENLAAGLCYTSGTTGNPKGVLYSHRSHYLHAMTCAMVDTLGFRGEDTILTIVPMFHANAWGIPYSALMVGARIVFPGPHLKPTDIAPLLQDHQVTIAAGVPTIWIGLLQELRTRQYDLKSLRTLVVGGAAIPQSLIREFEAEFNIPFLHLWGMTETSPLGTCSRLLEKKPGMPSEIRYEKKARQGFAAPGLEMRIVGDGNREQPWDGKSSGELQVRGPWVVSSYFRSPEGAAQFTNDGWFRTGDVSVIHPDGSMQIVDRTKDLIKSGGEWISSVALENALMAHPQVLEAVVVGVPDEKWSERPLAWVVPRAGADLSVEDLKEELGKSFIKFWIPEVIQFVPEIPKTSVGKFDKKRIRGLAEQGAQS